MRSRKQGTTLISKVWRMGQGRNVDGDWDKRVTVNSQGSVWRTGEGSNGEWERGVDGERERPVY